jgi:hypothetical protein
MNQIPPSVQQLLLKIREMLPPEKRERFCREAGRRVRQIVFSHTFLYALTGAVAGLVIEELTPFGLLDDATEVGAAVGAAIGYHKDWRIRQQQDQLRESIMESLELAYQEPNQGGHHHG